MAKITDLKMAVKPYDYYTKIDYRFQWERIEGRNWWLISIYGKVFAELFETQISPTYETTRWHALVYTKQILKNGKEIYGAKHFTSEDIDAITDHSMTKFEAMKLAICGAYLNQWC